MHLKERRRGVRTLAVSAHAQQSAQAQPDTCNAGTRNSHATRQLLRAATGHSLLLLFTLYLLFNSYGLIYAVLRSRARPQHRVMDRRRRVHPPHRLCLTLHNALCNALALILREDDAMRVLQVKLADATV